MLVIYENVYIASIFLYSALIVKPLEQSTLIVYISQSLICFIIEDILIRLGKSNA